MDSIKERFQARGISVEAEVGFNGPIIADEPRLMRVFLNLADNACKAMPNGGRFAIRVSRSEQFMVAEVSDTGVGMTPEVQKHMFEPFFSRSEEGGTGLGMTIVQNLVRAHRGELTVRSRRGHGTSFRITLPLFE